MQFRNIIGQDQIQQDLIRIARSNRVHHTQLFLGKPGAGALPFVVAYTQYLLCEQASENDSCGECNQCRKMQQLVHPDVHVTIPTVTRKKDEKPISDDFISEFRKFFLSQPYGSETDWLNYIDAGTKQGNITARECLEIIKTARYKKLEGKYKVNIIWMAEELAKEGNRLLKILEEPPEDTLFFLVAEDEDLILNTILSRSQITRLKRISSKMIEHYLIDQKEISDEKAKQISIIVDGDINKAIELATHKVKGQPNLLVKWLECIIRNQPKLVDFVEELSKQSKENLKNLLYHGTELFRETLILQESELFGHLPEQEQKVAIWLGKKLNLHQIHQLAEIFDEAIYAIERNVNTKILLMSISLEVDDIISQREVV